MEGSQVSPKRGRVLHQPVLWPRREARPIGGVDEVVSLAAAWMRVGGQTGDLARAQFSSGMVFEAPKAEELRFQHLSLSGRRLDFKSAYK